MQCRWMASPDCQLPGTRERIKIGEEVAPPRPGSPAGSASPPDNQQISPTHLMDHDGWMALNLITAGRLTPCSSQLCACRRDSSARDTPEQPDKCISTGISHL